MKPTTLRDESSNRAPDGSPSSIALRPIGVVHSRFTDVVGMPIQAAAVPEEAAPAPQPEQPTPEESWISQNEDWLQE